jgi:hypothetical protein
MENVVLPAAADGIPEFTVFSLPDRTGPPASKPALCV